MESIKYIAFIAIMLIAIGILISPQWEEKESARKTLAFSAIALLYLAMLIIDDILSFIIQ